MPVASAIVEVALVPAAKAVSMLTDVHAAKYRITMIEGAIA